MRLAHLGPSGTYTEAAAMRFNATADRLPTPTVAAAIEAVERGEADAAVCAVENSIEGPVNDTIDQMLRREMSLTITAELVLPIRHALIGASTTDPAAATRVYSHPQALAQCRRRLGELAPGAEPTAALSTAAAVEAALAEPGTLAVGNEHAARLYGARIFEADIGDEPGNETRFVVLGREAPPRSGDDKTSLAFTTQHDRPGSLVEVLQHFSTRGINMTRIESRPTRRRLGTYVFLVDVQGHPEDPELASALSEIESITHWMRVLGAYPRWDEGGEGVPSRDRA